MRSTSFRLGALLAVGVLGVHEFRYRLIDVESGAAASAGHGYLGALTALIGVAFVLALGRYVHLWVTRGPDEGALARRPTVVWLLVSAGVLVGYAGQELIAGWLSSGHPVGVAGLLAHGGWIAVPLSLAAGAVICLVIRTAAEVLRNRATVRSPEHAWSRRAEGCSPTAVVIGAGRVVARHLAGRSPPHQLSR